MKPTLEDFLCSGARWNGAHRGISFELSWHSLSDFKFQGIWCWYIILTEQQFYSEDWKKLRLEREDKQLFAGSWYRHFNYDSFPDVEPHSGWTFGEMDVFLGKDGKEYERVKVGCDYGHLCDEESGYWQRREDIERDVKRSIDLLCEMFPKRRERCAYSGVYDDSEKFYTAINGLRVHEGSLPKLQEAGWEKWMPTPSSNPGANDDHQF